MKGNHQQDKHTCFSTFVPNLQFILKQISEASIDVWLHFHISVKTTPCVTSLPCICLTLSE